MAVQSKLIPSHGDLQSWNPLIDHNSMALIEFETCQTLPFGHEFGNQALGETDQGRSDIAVARLFGEFDREFDVLWQAAGETYHPKALWD